MSHILLVHCMYSVNYPKESLSIRSIRFNPSYFLGLIEKVKGIFFTETYKTDEILTL